MYPRALFAPPVLHRNFIGGIAHSFGGSTVHHTKPRAVRELRRLYANLKRCEAIKAGTFKRERELKRA